MERFVFVVIQTERRDQDWLDFTVAASSLDIPVTVLFTGEGVNTLSSLSLKKALALLPLAGVESVFITRPVIGDCVLKTQLVANEHVEKLSQQTPYVFRW
jgi:hypothetical protein